MVEEEPIWRGSPSWKGELSIPVILVCILFTAGLGLLVYIPYLMKKTKKTEYRITDRRLVTSEGMLSTTENQVEWIRLKDISTSQSLLQGIVGVGDIQLITSDQTDPRKTLNSIPNHQELKEQIWKSAAQRREEGDVQLRENV